MDRGYNTDGHHLPRSHLYRVGVMSDLRIKPNTDNGDLSKDLEPITLGDCKIEFKDILNPTTLREWFEKVDGQENKDKEKD